MLLIQDDPVHEEASGLRSLLDGLQEGFFSLDEGWRFIEMNRAAGEHFGFSREAASGQRIYDLLPGFVGSEIEIQLLSVSSGNKRSIFEAPSTVRHGHTIEFTAFPLTGGLGVSFRDVTRKRQTENALRESQARLEIAATAADLGVWDWNLQTGEMLYSERAKALHGFPPGEPVTLAMITAATHRDDLPRTLAMAERALDPAIREHAPYEYRIIRPSDGQVRWMLAHGEVVYTADESPHPVRYVGTLQDVTPRHAAVEALRASEARLRLAIDAGHMAVWVYDLTRDTFEGSPELNRLYGLPPDAQPTVDELRACDYPGDGERVRSAYRDARERGKQFFEVEYRCIHSDGSVRWLLLRAENETNAAGEPSRIAGVLFDITERKRAEEHRELLINELNHRVKNTLATVQSITRQTLRLVGSPEQARQDIETRLIALARAHDMLTRESWESASLKELLTEAVAAHIDEGSGRLKLDGRDLRVGPQMALAFSMGVTELATNAVKYGALSNPTGSVHISWRISRSKQTRFLRLQWCELGGPPVRQPTRRGFGSRLIEMSLARELGGTVRIDFAATGLVCTFSVPLSGRERSVTKEVR